MVRWRIRALLESLVGVGVTGGGVVGVGVTEAGPAVTGAGIVGVGCSDRRQRSRLTLTLVTTHIVLRVTRLPPSATDPTL